MRWYVLQVKPGTDKEVVEALRRYGVTALAPEEQRLIRRRAVWVTEPRLLFGGYVFVQADYTDHLYYVLLGVPGVLRILRADGRPAPLPAAEAAYIVCLGWEMLQPSVVRRLPDGGGQPISGPLVDLDPDMYRINWHRRRAIVTLTILGDAHEIELSILPATPAGLPPAPPVEQTPGSPAG